jgi:hypothetical protein
VVSLPLNESEGGKALSPSGRAPVRQSRGVLPDIQVLPTKPSAKQASPSGARLAVVPWMGMVSLKQQSEPPRYCPAKRSSYPTLGIALLYYGGATFQRNSANSHAGRLLTRCGLGPPSV